MASTVTAQELQHLIPDLDIVAIDTRFFIIQAGLIVTEDLSNSGMSTARLKQIELMLAAHFTIIGTEKGGLIEVESMNTKEVYAIDPKKEGLAKTRWGEQAIILDTTGALAGLNSTNKTAQFRIA